MIEPSKGLRQGCPLSPYLFVMCMERLGQWLTRRIVEGRLREVRASRKGPGLSYLFFTDDFLLFSEVSVDQLACIKEGLELFCGYSGQRVNYGKSSMFFSANVSEQDASRLSTLMGIPLKTNIGKYLGQHIVQGGNNRERYTELTKRVHIRDDGWKLCCLSRAGRLTLA